MLFICSMSEGSFRRFWGWNRRNARLVLGLNGLLTALIGEEWEASAAAGESSSANTGSSQSNVPGEMQSKHVGYYVWRAVWYWACTSDFCNMQNWHHCETFSAWLGSAWWWTKRVFIVFILSLLAHSGALARLCVHAAVPELHPTALLSVWNSPAFRELCGVHGRQLLTEITVSKGAVLPASNCCMWRGRWALLPPMALPAAQGCASLQRSWWGAINSNQWQVAAESAVSSTGWLRSDCCKHKAQWLMFISQAFWFPHHVPCSWAQINWS